MSGDYLVQKFLSGSEIGLNQCLTLAVLIEDGYQVPLSKDKFGMTPLHHFVRDSRMDSAVEAMVEVQGVDVNLPDDYGWSVLHHAVEAREGDLKLALIRLLKLRADTEAKSKRTSGPALQRTSDKAVADFKLPAKSTALDLLERMTGGSQVPGRQLLE
jgi:ankyrin repeat protein